MLGSSLFKLDVSEQKVQKEEAVLILSIEMDPNLLLLIMMTIVLYFFTTICLAVITAGQQRVFAVQAGAGRHQEARRDTKGRGHYNTSGETNH